MVNQSHDPAARLINLLGAAALGISDAIVGDVATAHGLDATSAAVLVGLLDLARSSPIQRLSQWVGISHSGAVRLVNRLGEAGLVERSAGHDGRSVTVSLTHRGQVLARRLRSERREAISAAVTQLSAEEQNQLTSICETLVAGLRTSRLALRQAGGSPSGGALCRLCDPAACGRAEGRCPAAAPPTS